MDPNNHMVLYQKGGDIHSGGFKVESPIMTGGSSLMKSTHQRGGSGSIESPFAIPIGLLFKPSTTTTTEKSNETYENVKVIGNDIYDKLLELMQVGTKSKSRTKRHRNHVPAKTTRRAKSKQ